VATLVEQLEQGVGGNENASWRAQGFVLLSAGLKFNKIGKKGKSLLFLENGNIYYILKVVLSIQYFID
jgi:hypothetical protein